MKHSINLLKIAIALTLFLALVAMPIMAQSDTPPDTPTAQEQVPDEEELSAIGEAIVTISGVIVEFLQKFIPPLWITIIVLTLIVILFVLRLVGWIKPLFFTKMLTKLMPFLTKSSSKNTGTTNVKSRRK